MNGELDSGTTSDSSEDVIMEVRDASVTFDMERGESRVIDNASLDIRREEVLGIVGESGSGKSMLANILLDAVPSPGQSNGSVKYYPESNDEPLDILELNGEEIRRVRWEEIAMVFQGAQSSFNPTMKIANHFKETLDNHGYDIESGMDRAYQLLSDLYMDPVRVLDSFPHELSGGMRQRTLIALSLILEPDVLVLDEPTAALDLLMQQSILNLLKRIKEQYELTLVFITHDLPLVAGLADRLAVMYAFQMVEVGPTQKMLTEATHPYTRLLLRSTPSLDVSLDQMQTVEGSSPDPINVPSGCSFHPRCPLATEQCSNIDPEFEAVASEHEVACFHWEQSEAEIPLSFEEPLTDEPANDTAVTLQSSDEPLLSLNNLSIHFQQRGDVIQNILGESEAVIAVDDIDLDIYENDVIALVGESGCGKTTLGKAAIGLQRPTHGTVTYRDQDIWDAHDDESWSIPFLNDDKGDVSIPFSDIRRALQIIHQDPASAINPNKTVMSSLSKPLKRWYPNMDHNEQEVRIYALLEQVGMTPPKAYAKRYPHQLSGGEQQRVALIRALLMNPSLILADEAISALDVSLRVEMMELFIELQETFNTSYLFISHDLSNARYLAEKADGRIAVMYLGEIVEIGPVEAVIENPEHPYTKVLRWATPSLKSAQEEQTEPPVRDIDIPDPTDRPTGCRFHTRCPEAREVCATTEPEKFETEDGKHVACFRAERDHEYWESEPLYDDVGEFDSSGPVAESVDDD